MQRRPTIVDAYTPVVEVIGRCGDFMRRFAWASQALGLTSAVQLLILDRLRTGETALRSPSLHGLFHYRGWLDAGALGHLYRPGYRVLIFEQRMNRHRPAEDHSPAMASARLAIGELFANLETQSIEYCVLRNYERLPSLPDGDIDILVSPNHLDPFETTVREVFSKFGARIIEWRAAEGHRWISLLIGHESSRSQGLNQPELAEQRDGFRRIAQDFGAVRLDAHRDPDEITRDVVDLLFPLL